MGPQFSLSGIEAQWGWGQSSVFWDLGSHGGAGVRVQSVQDQGSVRGWGQGAVKEVFCPLS